MTVSLVFRKVSEEDLSKTYTCKLETEHDPSSFVTITLAKTGTQGKCIIELCVYFQVCHNQDNQIKTSLAGDPGIYWSHVYSRH